jgi:hypothetical protein
MKTIRIYDLERMTMQINTTTSLVVVVLAPILTGSEMILAAELCKPSQAFKPSMGACVQVNTGLKWWSEGAAIRIQTCR